MPNRSDEMVVVLSDVSREIAHWSIQKLQETFQQAVDGGYLAAAPPPPTLTGNVLTLPLNLLVLEEFDYQLTIGFRDNPDAISCAFDTAVGDALASIITAAVFERAPYPRLRLAS